MSGNSRSKTSGNIRNSPHHPKKPGKDFASQPSAAPKPEEQNIVSTNQLPSQEHANANSKVPQAKDKLEKNSAEQASGDKTADKAASAMAETQKPSTPESEKGNNSQLQPKDLEFGKTITSIMDALGLLEGKDAEECRKEYQALLQEQKELEAQITSEKIKSWQKNIDMTKEFNVRREAPGLLYKSLRELHTKYPEQSSNALAEYEKRKKFIESLRSKPQEKHVTHIDVQPTLPTERKDDKEGKDDVVPTSSGSDQTDGNKKDHGNFRVLIPEGYQLIQEQELEKMRYELVNQKESIEELTTRLSAIASNKLKEGNPNIADLSDKNRPTKLGEHFASLYDDEWSEALEELGKDKKEKEEEDDDDEDMKSVEKLLDVVKYAYKFCGEKADEQLQKIAMGMKDAVCLTPPMVVEVTTTDSKSKPSTKSENKADIKMDATKEATSGSRSAKNSTKGATEGQTKERPGAASQSGQTPGSVGGQSARKTGAVKSQAGKATGVSPSSTPPGTPNVVTKVQKEAPEVVKTKTVMSETWLVALRFARTFRKETAMTAITQIKQLFKAYYINTLKLASETKFPAAMEKYIDRCVELIWLMAVQDPPMEIKWVNPGERSNTNYFKFYQSKGKMVKQCVWPAVFLSANGGIVSKGYIIGMAPPDTSKAE